MTTLRAASRRLIGLFVDDGAFALQIATVLIVAALSATLLPNVPLAAGAILLSGCLGALLGNVLRSRGTQPGVYGDERRSEPACGRAPQHDRATISLAQRSAGTAVEDRVFANLIPPVLGLIAIGVFAGAVWTWDHSKHSSDSLPHCAAMVNDLERLHCYDRLTMPRQPAKGALAPLDLHLREIPK